MDKDRSRPIPLNSAIVTNDSILAIAVADARGRSLAIVVATTCDLQIPTPRMRLVWHW